MTFLYIIVALAIVFDFINGFHDSANSIATVVSTKVLSPLAAVSMAAFFNFIAFTVFPLKVATTIGKGVVEPDVLNLTVIGAALVAAIIWNLITWWWGLPSSSSHTLVGGLVGAALVSSGPGSIITSGVIKILAFIVISPLLGMIFGFTISTIVQYLARKHTPFGVDKHFRRLQLVSAAAFSLGHGGNDAQKSMGIIWIALIVYGLMTKDAARPPLWVILSCQTSIFGATHFGIPVSTTHTITGAIIGVGSRKGLSAVKWGVTRKIFWAWIFTIPVSGLIGAVMYYLFNLIKISSI
jgi:PiT family inorganic phosphate transporter